MSVSRIMLPAGSPQYCACVCLCRSMTRMLAEAVARYPHLSRLAAVSDSEFMASHAPKASAVSHDKSELFQRFVDEERSSVALTPLDEGKGVDARKGEPLTLDDLEFVHEPGFNWDDPLFLEKAVET